MTLRQATPTPSATLEFRRLWERRYRRRLALSDALMIAATVAAVLAAAPLMGDQPAGLPVHLLLLAAVWHVLLGAMRTRSAALFRSSASEYRAVVDATGLAFGLVALVGVAFDRPPLQASVVVGLPVGVALVVLSRWLWRNWLATQRRHQRYTSRTLIVGNQADVEYVLDFVKPCGGHGYRAVGATIMDSGIREIVRDGIPIPVLGHTDNVADTAALLCADTIIVASRPEGDPEFIKRLSWELEGAAAELVLSSPLTDVAGPRLSFVPMDGLPLIHVVIPSYAGVRHVLKRALDIVVATLALIPIGLITPVIALLIKLESPGPVFFIQQRVGRNGQTFPMVKFRSMRTDAEQQLSALVTHNEGSGPLFKMKDDPRVTAVGRVLRRFSLDELPQFWNVLVGDMSVVGPRPPLPREVTSYDGVVFRRLYIKPGITGLWQVSGRSDLSWDESVRLDLRYVENWSVMSDLQIMWRTVKVMIHPKGAY